MNSFDPNSEVAQRFFGAWRYLGTFIDGERRENRGPDPKGLIIYCPSGHMAVEVIPDRERGKAGDEPTPQEAKEAIADLVAYFGTYTIDEAARTVTHHRWGSVQPGDHGDLVRGYRFENNLLILRPVGTRQDVRWERLG